MTNRELLLRFRAPDRPGILAAVTPLLAARGCDIREAQVHGDTETGLFFVRMVLASPLERDLLHSRLASAAAELKLALELYDLADRPRVLIAVSRLGHCLLDLLHRRETGQLPVEIVGVVSNHDALRRIADWHEVPFHFLPMESGKEAQEKAFVAILEESAADLLVLARYMQVLSADLADRLAGRCINIHHSFLPSFKGARPYHQAHARGVKLIGATAHYVTAQLDEGPIIEQDVRRVTHAASAKDMVHLGREIEASVLARAVRWHAEHRIFLNGQKTVVLQ